MASKTYLVESELLTQMQDLQNRFGVFTQKVGALQASCVQRLRKGGTAGSTITTNTLTRINTDIRDFNTALQVDLVNWVSDLAATLELRINGSPTDNTLLSDANFSVDGEIAPFFGVADGGDIPYAWWINDTDEIFIGTEVDPDSDLIATLALADNDVIYVQDTNATTDDDHGAGIQKNRRLLVVDAEGDNTHVETGYFGNIQLSTDIETPYPARDLGALTTNSTVVDTKLVLRKVFDAVV